MPRKIYDIKPPKVAQTVEKDLKEFLTKDRVKKPNNRRKKESQSIFWPVSVVVGIIIISAGTYLFFKLPKVEVAIWPKVETLSFQQFVTADESADLVDTENNIIPAKYFQADKTVSQNFPATGNATDEGRATGNIVIYNKYDPPAPLTLKAGTHFMSDSGKLFKTYQKVVIPAAKKTGSKITPGSMQIEVQAAEGGSDYNIAPSGFSVPGLKGTSYYYAVYATSTEPMEGGYAGKVKKATSDDIQTAKDVLIKKAETDVLSDLMAQIPSDYVLIESAISSDIVSASTETKSGAIVESFDYQVTAKASVLTFKKSDLEQLEKSYIISQIPDGKTLLDSSFYSDYLAKSVEVDSGKIVLDVNFSSGVYQAIDKNSMSLSVLGENSSQIQQVVGNALGDHISGVDVKFWPFWVTSAPNSQKAVSIELKFK